METGKEIITRPDGALQNYEGLETPVDTRDLIIPKVLLMQGLSQFVADGKAVSGEMRDSLNCTKLGTKAEALEIIPFHMNKTWIIFEEVNGKLQYKEQVAQTPENLNWKWNDVVDGVNVRRDQSINYFVLLPWEIKEEIFFPYMISFRRTSYMAGKKLETARVKYGAFGKPIHIKTFNLHSLMKENDQGKFFVYDITENRKTSDEEMKAVERWKKVITSTQIKVDDSDLEKEAEAMHAKGTQGEYTKGDQF